IFLEYATDDFGLFFDDLPLSRLTWNRSVAECQAASVEALANPPGLAAANLVCVIFTIELAYQPTEADENSVGDAVVHSTDFDVEKGQALMDTRQVFHVAREPVE